MVPSIVSSVSVQLITKASTIGINVLVARYVNPATFGTAQISFALLENLSLCLLKEGFRRTALRTNDAAESKQTKLDHKDVEDEHSKTGAGVRRRRKQESVDRQKTGRLRNDAEQSSQPPASTQADPKATSLTDDKFNSCSSSAAVSCIGCLATVAVSLLLALLWMFALGLPLGHDLKEGDPATVSIFDNVALWYRLSICVVCMGIILQSLAEPLLVQCLLNQHTSTRAKIEGYSIVGKTLATPASLYCLSSYFRVSANQRVSIELISFAFGHFIYGLVWLWGFSRIVDSPAEDEKEEASALPSSMTDGSDDKDNKLLCSVTGARSSEPKLQLVLMEQAPASGLARLLYAFRRYIFNPKAGVLLTRLSTNHKRLLPSYLILACEKVLLNELERLVALCMFSPNTWAVYALVGNLGSLICRLILNPIDEIVTVVFSTRQVETPSWDAVDGSYKPGHNYLRKGDRGSPACQAEKPSVAARLQLPLLAFYVGCEVAVSVTALLVGFPVAGALLYVLYGTKWVAMGSHFVLQRYAE